ncbi:hypothetical protein TD95_001096 [Thielaviopsis punctulata]|uniref:Hemerythrin-like domain-containing protein n=1 Tax=Thielaviopsis punctulata TaxID=72032 RepID=A0A0F4ZJ46_9PEZI|nr:hypothetical protein TD95_001096 [Thielaviopsis punctulata]
MLAVLLVLPAALISLFLSRAPCMMTSTTPTSGVQWADGPLKLVATPTYETKRTDIFTTGASHMALVHNVILRGFNSVYLQAKRVPAADKPAFIGYAQTWHKFVVSHHNDEEENLFPKIAEMLRDDKIWAETLEEHETFMDGMRDFGAYLAGLSADPAAFSGVKLVSIMDTFKAPFEQHFHSEIQTIAGLHSHANAPIEGSAEQVAASALFKTWGKATVSKAGVADAVPFFLMNLDSTAEEGLWANWPPMPAPIKWGLVNLAGSYYGSYWKFSSCDSNQMPRELYAINMPEQE